MRKTGLALIIGLLLAAALFQLGVDKTPAGASTERREYFPAATSLLDFLGGIRQYVACTLYIKTDKLHHTYYGGAKNEGELIPYFILISLLDPNYVDAYYVGSDLIWQQGREDEAIDFILQGIRANPDSADLYAGLADFYLESGRYEEAREAFENALQRESEILTRKFLMTGLSATYTALGDEDEARKILVEMAIYNGIRLYGDDIDEQLLKNIIKRINNDMNTAVPQERFPGGGP